MMEQAGIKRKLQSTLTNKRYLHSLGVAEEAARLAETHGANVFKAETAGLLHDCAKCMPDELKLRLCKEFHVPVNKAMHSHPDLLHSFLGAEIAARDYNISDSEILDAIRYHTTGRPNMGILEKIIYLADFFEPNRKPFNSMETIRELAYKSLNEAVLFSLDESVKLVRQKDLLLHKLTLEALIYYTKEE